jgi:hypothetical protein
MPVASLNARTLANIVAGSNDPQQVLWMTNIYETSRGHMPIKEWFGGLGGGRPIIEVLDTRRLQGQEVVATVRAGLGQRGTTTGQTRADKSEKQKSSDYRVKIGLRHHCVSQERIAADMTVIGSKFDKTAGPDLAEWHSVRQQSDVEAEMFKRAHERNTLRPNNKSHANYLVSNDTFSLNSVMDIREGMFSLGATALKVRKGPNAEVVSSYYIQGSQFLFADLNRDPGWQNLRAIAENRGAANSVFAGGKPMFENCILNEWELKLNDFNASQGARIMPIAVLGAAIAAAPDSATADNATGSADGKILSYKYIYGGGNNTAAANTEVDYFQNFKAAQYVGYEGEKIAATTDVEYYVAIKSMSGANKGKIRLFAYQVNDGNKLTITRALSSSAPGSTSLKFTALSTSTDYGAVATWDSGAWVAATYLTQAEMPAGSIIYQCNIKGQCLCYGYGIGNGFLFCGYGSSDGKTAFGRRTTENQDYGSMVGIGCEVVWGCRATEDTNRMVNGYTLYEAAYNPSGFPQIES